MTFLLKKGLLEYMDLHSTNGSYMDGRQISPGMLVDAAGSSMVTVGPFQLGVSAAYRTPEAAAAIDFGVPTYRFVRCYIERRIAPQLTLRQVDPLIRELTQYRGLINHMTKESE